MMKHYCLSKNVEKKIKYFTIYNMESKENKDLDYNISNYFFIK